MIAGRYRLLDPVGAGAMGSVWRARDVRTGDLVALKVLPGGGAAEPLLRFVREQGVRVDHPHVLTPVGWSADDRGAAIAMRPVRGGSAADLLAEHGPLPADWVAVVLDQLLRALAAVHEAGIVHRDVKPANVLLEPTGTGRPHALLADFGVAVPLDGPRLTRHAEVVGTDGYLPPEQAAGAPPDPRQDLYAVGATAVELLTGVPPHHRPARPRGRLGPLLTALLDPDPDRRPRSAGDAVDLLRRLGVPTGAPWRAGARPPEVPDRWGPAPGAGTARDLGLAALGCFAGAAALAALALGLLMTRT